MNKNQNKSKYSRFDRSVFFKIALYGFGFIFVVQLFNIQILKHDFYAKEALAEHVKKFEIPAKRGIIYANDGYQKVPLVLNEDKYIVYADPKFITDSRVASEKLVAVMGGDVKVVQEQLNKNSRYVILAKKINKDVAERIKELKIKGVGIEEVSVRTYPQGQLASHVLGFVNDDGEGQYGVESFLNDKLAGKSGQKNEITDVNGTPLAVNNDITKANNPSPGEDIELTIDLRLQQIVENQLKDAVTRTNSQKGSVVIIDPNNGQIKAMANYPTYNPADYAKTEDLSVFTNTAISGAWEPGSVMKPITMSASFNEGKLSRQNSYYDAGFIKAGDTTIKNAVEFGAQTMTIDDVITKSLNTGAVYLYKSLGGGNYNEQARNTWFDYLTNHYMFNKVTGIELANEQPGFVKAPKDDGAGIDVTYANMAFGQGMTITPLQLASAYSALTNGGIYYKPTIIKATSDKNAEFVDKKAEIVKSDVISKPISDDIKDLLHKSLLINNKKADRAGYLLGAKSGTAQVSDGAGRYKENAYNGAYVGYLEGKKLEYVVVTRMDEPKTSGFASFQAGILWSEITNEIIDSVAIEPR